KKVAAAVGWALIVTALSHGFIDSRAFAHQVSQTVPQLTTEQGFSNFWRSWWWLFVKGWHVLEFLILTMLVLRFVRNLWAGAAIGLLAAGLDEWHQTFIPHRGGRLSDVAIDMIGVVLAVLITWRIRSSSSRKVDRHGLAFFTRNPQKAKARRKSFVTQNDFR
ncbi:MAG TPA: VanZ family protein, partial [Fimbriimonadaceae bacterium]|nr:VanZ family protein [Fimbriimonadaceae bacterium]